MKYVNPVTLFLLSLTFAFLKPAGAQVKNTFNLNIDNGLPSNHAYGTITDRHGYLWIATEKGVVRYNGYETKVFNLSQGLPNEDVWQLFEDYKGRIWLGNISDEIGYIYNNKYHRPFQPNFRGTIYPEIIVNSTDGIAFAGAINGRTAISMEHNDTMTYHFLDDTSFFKYASLPTFKLMHSIKKFDNASQSVFSINNFFYRASFKKGAAIVEKIAIDSTVRYAMTSNVNLAMDNTLLSIPPTTKGLFSLNLTTGSANNKIAAQFKQDVKINFAHPDSKNKMLYIISDDSVYELSFDNEAKILRSTSIRELLPGSSADGNNIRTINKYPFWNTCMGTINSGLFIRYNAPSRFKLMSTLNLSNYKYLGSIKDSISFWWNAPTGTMAFISKGTTISYKKYPFNARLYNLCEYKKDTLLIAGAHSVFFTKNGKMTDARLLEAFVAEATDNQHLYAVLARGFYRATRVKDSAFRAVPMDLGRYTGLVYDGGRNNYWAYNHDNIFIHNATRDKDTVFSKEQLAMFGIKKVEKVAIDNTYGNIFLNGYNNVTIYDPEKNTFHDLFGNYNLKESSILIYHNTLIVAGQFGLLFSRITGRGQVSKPLYYPNLKNINYGSINDCAACFGKILINTDKGVYGADMPTDDEILHQPEPVADYKFLLNYRDSITNIVSGDTIVIDPKELKLQFDVINAYGTGHLVYMYRIAGDTMWHELNANELTLPQLQAGKYYTLSVAISDNSWRSSPVNLQLYIRPEWWQTPMGRKLTWFTTFLLIILLFAAAVFITKKLVLNAAKKRNLRMELELKAIYAQINPHFIFNSLNSALLMVSKNRMEEAYTHISKFSRLLRSYIKSSRNKLITLSEEINNLEDYIELQQTRFKNRFDLAITVDNSIDARLVKIPSLLLQPFVENAINHGLLQREDTGYLKINFTAAIDRNEITCIIDDDGIGRKRSAMLSAGNKDKEGSYGDLLIKDLVSIFNKYEDMNIEIKYTDKPGPATGTIVTIQIKNPHYAA